MNTSNILKLCAPKPARTQSPKTLNFIEKLSDQQALQRIYSDGRIAEEEMREFYTIFKTDRSSFENFINNQALLIKTINARYKLNTYSQDRVISVLEGAVKDLIIVRQPEFAVTTEDCRNVWLAKLVLNASLAVAGYQACMPLIAAGGLPGIICTAAVFAGHEAANYIALSEYRDCIKKR